MKRIALGLLVLLGACSKEPPMPLDLAQSKQMIWDTIKQYHDATDRNEIDLISTLLAPEVSMIANDQDVIRGHDLVVRAVRDKLAKLEKDLGSSRSTITGKEVIKPEGDFAFVTYVASVGDRRGIITAICRRNKDGKWLIAHLHDTWSTTPKK